jgi:hypothetical protein
MTVFLSLLLIALVSLTSSSLLRASVEVERSSLVPLADAAINEVLLKMKADNKWGTHTTDKLFLKFNQNDISVGGLNENKSPFSPLDISKRTNYSYDRGCFYISFDPNDPVFTGIKYYSVNNLDPMNNPPPTIKSWRRQVDPNSQGVPSGAASIVVTTIIGNSVKHVEVIVKKVSMGAMENGSRGHASISTDKFTLQSINGKPTFHSNDNVNANSIEIYDTAGGNTTATIIKDHAKVTANSNISLNSNTSPDPNFFTPNFGEKQVPDLSLHKLLGNLTFSAQKIPSGTYVVNGNQLWYYNDSVVIDPAAPLATLPDPLLSGGQKINRGQNILGITGFKFGDDKKIYMTKNFEIQYNASHDPGSTGNFTLIGGIFRFTDPLPPSSGSGSGSGSGSPHLPGALVTGYTIHSPGDRVTRDYTKPGNPYKYGNISIINLSDKALEGQGNFYSEGNLLLASKTVVSGISTKKVAVYAWGDVNINSTEDSIFDGLVFTNGDFNCNVNSSSKTLTVNGALVVAGKDPNTFFDPNDPTTGDPNCADDPGLLNIKTPNLVIKFDNSLLSALTYKGGGTDFCVVSWHEF